MATTTNLGLTKPANGSDVDTWDVPVNGNSDVLDAVAGGVTTINAVSASGTVVLTQTQYRPRILVVSGALTANVNYQLPTGIGGTWSVGNATSGAFTITISSGGGGTAVLVPQGGRSLVCCDGANIFLADSSGPIPVGLIAIWSGSTGSIPANWHLCDGTSGTVDLRSKFIVGAGSTYAVGATGGQTAVTPTITVDSHTLSITEMPAHTHVDSGHTHTDAGHFHGLPGGLVAASGSSGATSGSGVGLVVNVNPTASANADIQSSTANLQNTGGGGGHAHTASSTAVGTLPPYYALAFIQKIA